MDKKVTIGRTKITLKNGDIIDGIIITNQVYTKNVWYGDFKLEYIMIVEYLNQVQVNGTLEEWYKIANRGTSENCHQLYDGLNI